MVDRVFALVERLMLGDKYFGRVSNWTAFTALAYEVRLSPHSRFDIVPNLIYVQVSQIFSTPVPLVINDYLKAEISLFLYVLFGLPLANLVEREYGTLPYPLNQTDLYSLELEHIVLRMWLGELTLRAFKAAFSAEDLVRFDQVT